MIERANRLPLKSHRICRCRFLKATKDTRSLHWSQAGFAPESSRTGTARFTWPCRLHDAIRAKLAAASCAAASSPCRLQCRPSSCRCEPQHSERPAQPALLLPGGLQSPASFKQEHSIGKLGRTRSIHIHSQAARAIGRNGGSSYAESEVSLLWTSTTESGV